MRLLLAPSCVSAMLSLVLSCGGPAAGSGANGSPAPASTSASRPPAPATSPVAPGQELAASTIAAGRSGEMRGGRQEHLFTGEAEWTAWLARVQMTPDDVPPIRFDVQVVIAVDGEDGSNGCHAVRITRVTHDGSRYVSDVARYVPGPESRCTMMMVRPFHAVAVPRVGEAAAASFTWRVVTGEPPPADAPRP